MNVLWEEEDAAVLFRMPYGKYKGLTVLSVWKADPSYVTWAARNWKNDEHRDLVYRCLDVLEKLAYEDDDAVRRK